MNHEIFEKVIAEIDRRNECDPNIDLEFGIKRPKELLYSERMVEMLNLFNSSASLELQVSCRAQHIERWIYPRSEYELGRTGYLSWRKMLYTKHSEITTDILASFGASSDFIEIVRSIMENKVTGIGESQTLEDVTCLVFLKHYFSAFIDKQNGDKLNRIVQKTWAKMSSNGQAFALTIDFPENQFSVLKEALGI